MLFARIMSDEGKTIGPYTLTSLIGAGGMGEVYKATDTRLNRTVAIKVLQERLAGSRDYQERFEREARLIGQLNHPRICTLHDIGKEAGMHYLVMEYVDGVTLEQRLRQGPLPLNETLGFAVQIADALAAAHRQGIVHRDLKPGNVMLTRSGVKLLDFGLAKFALQHITASQAPTKAQLTEEGVILGTLQYMAPEQVEGKEANIRTDVFAFGAVVHEMLTGQKAFAGDSKAALMAAILKDTPPPVSGILRTVPSAIDKVIARCLEKDPAHRFASMDEVREIFELNREQGVRASRVPRTALAAGVALAVLAAAVWGVSHYLRVSRARWVEAEALPQIARLVNESRMLAAVDLLRQAEEYDPASPAVLRMKDELALSDSVLETTPDGADIYIRDYAGDDASWQLLGRSPLRTNRIPIRVSSYRIRVTKAGYEPAEFVVALGNALRAALQIPLHTTAETPPGMVWVRGITETGRSQTGPAVAPGLAPDFWLDRTEVTNKAFNVFVDKGGYANPEYWKHPFVKDGKDLSWQEAMHEFRDATGKPGPSTWELGSYPEGQAEFPVGGVSWYEAAAYAAFVGKELPTAYHWFRAAAFNAMSEPHGFNNFSGRGPMPAGASPGLGRFGTADMPGNVQEWVFNATGDLRLTLGGAWNTPSYLFGMGRPDARRPFDREPTFGFRCAQSTSKIPEELYGVVEFVSRDRRKDKPVDDKTYALLEKMHRYDKTDLQGTRDSVEDTSELWRVEHVSFRAAYGNERVSAHLFIPKNFPTPHQVVVLMGGIDFLTERTCNENCVRFYFKFLIQSGRAVMLPVYKGTLERGPGAYYHLSDEPNRWIEMNLQWSKDLGRSIDFLETRKDIDASKLAFFGVSLGGAMTPRLIAVEPRIKTAIMLSGGSFEKVADVVDAWNFAPRVKIPVLMLNGREDAAFPLESSQIPLYQLLGTPARDKDHQVSEGGHASPVSRLDVVKKALDWLDRYLGPVRNTP
jgi:eukaryotic-like serine/threonine-protein kinase